MENRRQFIKNGLMICLGTGGAILSSQAFGSPQFSGESWGMIIDTSRCMGCYSCMVACKYQSNTSKDNFNTRIEEQEKGIFPNAGLSFSASICMQCIDPECLKACQNDAIFIDDSGIVMTDWNRCDGNGACVSACPFQARFLDPRFENRSDKCDFCSERLGMALMPSCVENCAGGARIFGRFDKPEGEFGEYLKKMTDKEMRERKTAVIFHSIPEEGGSS